MCNFSDSLNEVGNPRVAAGCFAKEAVSIAFGKCCEPEMVLIHESNMFAYIRYLQSIFG